MDTNSAPVANTISYGDHTINLDALPPQSILALVRRGLSHYLGNEQASKVKGWVDRCEKGNDEVAPFTPTDEQVDAKKAEMVAAAIQALVDGTVGVRAVAGPKASPIDQLIRAAAKKEVEGVLKSQNTKIPKGDEKVTFGDGQALSMSDLIARRIVKHGERLRKEAEAEMKRREREIAKSAEAGLDELL